MQVWLGFFGSNEKFGMGSGSSSWMNMTNDVELGRINFNFKEHVCVSIYITFKQHFIKSIISIVIKRNY